LLTRTPTQMQMRMRIKSSLWSDRNNCGMCDTSSYAQAGAVGRTGWVGLFEGGSKLTIFRILDDASWGISDLRFAETGYAGVAVGEASSVLLLRGSAGGLPSVEGGLFRHHRCLRCQAAYASSANLVWFSSRLIKSSVSFICSPMFCAGELRRYCSSPGNGRLQGSLQPLHLSSFGSFC